MSSCQHKGGKRSRKQSSRKSIRRSSKRSSRRSSKRSTRRSTKRGTRRSTRKKRRSKRKLKGGGSEVWDEIMGDDKLEKRVNYIFLFVLMLKETNSNVDLKKYRVYGQKKLFNVDHHLDGTNYGFLKKEDDGNFTLRFSNNYKYKGEYSVDIDKTVKVTKQTKCKIFNNGGTYREFTSSEFYKVYIYKKN